MNRRRAWADDFAYLAVRVLAAALEMFPVEADLRLMRFLGGLWFDVPQRLPPARAPGWMAAWPPTRWTAKVAAALVKLRDRFCEHRRRAEAHVRMCFPEYDEARVSAVARQSMQQLAMLAVEVLRSPRLITQWTWARHIRLGKLDEALRVLLERRGCIMLTGHFGNWELLGFALATLGFEITAVMRPLDNERLNRFLLDRRERSGLKLLYKKGATRSAAEVLESNGTLCFIADQNAGRKGLFVDFFGRAASTYKSIGLLAIQHRVPIVVGRARRIGAGFQYEIGATRIIRPEEWEGRPDELTWITREYSKAMEDFIREAPEQYLWIHRRWKSRPRDKQATDEAVTST